MNSQNFANGTNLRNQFEKPKKKVSASTTVYTQGWLTLIYFNLLLVNCIFLKLI